jgi:hypothetical protein
VDGWNEAAMANYLLENLLSKGDDGSISSSWRCGLGIVPPGFTTYSPNIIERSWRTLKGLVQPRWGWLSKEYFFFPVSFPHRTRRMEPATLLVEVCSAFASRLNAGFYNDMHQEVPVAWPALRSRSAKQYDRVDEMDIGDEEEKLCKRQRLDLDSLLKHFRKKGPCGTWKATSCDLVLQDASVAQSLYVFGKYDLNAVTEKRDDTFAAMRLCLARAASEVEAACADPETGLNQIN